MIAKQAASLQVNRLCYRVPSQQSEGHRHQSLHQVTLSANKEAIRVLTPPATTSSSLRQPVMDVVGQMPHAARNRAMSMDGLAMQQQQAQSFLRSSAGLPNGPPNTMSSSSGAAAFAIARSPPKAKSQLPRQHCWSRLADSPRYITCSMQVLSLRYLPGR